MLHADQCRRWRSQNNPENVRLTDICLYHQVLGWTGSSVQLLAATYQQRVNRTTSGTFVRHEPRYMSHSFYISVLLLIRIFCRKWKFLSLLWNFQKFCFTYYFKYKTKGKKSINIITCRENRCLNKTFSDWQLYSSCWGWIKHHFWHHHHYNQILLWSDYPKTKLMKPLNDLVTLIWMQWILSYTHSISSRITHCHG